MVPMMNEDKGVEGESIRVGGREDDENEEEVVAALASSLIEVCASESIDETESVLARLGLSTLVDDFGG